MKKCKRLCCILLVVLLCTVTLGNFSVVSYAAKGDLGEGYGVDNLNLEFTTVDGDKVSSRSEGIVTILLFARTNGMCLNSTNVIRTICGSDWIDKEDVRLVVVDIDQSPVETVRAMQEQYGNDAALFCYDESYAASNALFSYLRNTMGAVSSVTLPVMVIIDGNNKVQYCTTGNLTANQIYSYVADLAGWSSLEETSGKLDVYVEGTFDEEEAFKVLELVNQARAEQGKNPLKMDETLVDKAMQRAAECSVYYSHTRPNGESCFSILESPYTMGCAENIAAGQSNAQNVVTSWLNSPGHYANIMNENYESIGIGCFYQNGIRYWTQLFSVYSGTEKTKEANSVKKAVVKADSDNLGSLSLQYENQQMNVGEVAEPVLRLDNLGFGFSVPSTDNIVFKTSNEAVAKVDEDGTVHAISEGNAVITAILADTVKAEYTVTVGEAQVASSVLHTIHGEEISIEADGTKEVTMLIFGQTFSMNTVYELQSISESDWISNSDIRVIFAEISQADLETTKNFASQYDQNNISFCYDEGIQNLQMFNKYLEIAGMELATTPLTVLIDKDNNIQKILAGIYSSDELFDEMKQFAVLDDGNNNSVIMGDLDGDRKINLNDAKILLKGAVGIITLTDEQIKAADINNDKKINLNDAKMVLRIAVGIAN